MMIGISNNVLPVHGKNGKNFLLKTVKSKNPESSNQKSKSEINQEESSKQLKVKTLTSPFTITLLISQRMASSVPYVKAQEPHHLETYMPEVLKAYVESRLNSTEVILK